MTDNRTNEPTYEQVLAAAKAIEKIPHIVWNSPMREDAMTLARAALVAAQGATPAQPSNGADEDVLSAVRAERDAALARIAELEEALTKECRDLARTTVHTAAAMGTMRLTMGEEMVKLGYEGLREKLSRAEARIAEAAKLHRKYTYYDLEDSCPDTTDEHREEHHHEASDDIGEFYCDQMPTGDVACDNCRDVNGDRMEWPCPTAVSLGLNEGGSND